MSLRKLLRGACIPLICLVMPAAGQEPGAGDSAYPEGIHPVTGSRLPPVRRADLDDFGRRLYDTYIEEGRSFDSNTGPRGIRIHSPRVADYMTTGNRYLRYDAGIEPRLRELIILVAAREMDSDYEWSAHEDLARQAGLGDEVIDTIRHARPVPSHFGEVETTVIALGRQLLRGHKLDADTYGRALDLFGRKKLVDVVSLLSHYTATAILLTAFDQQLPPGESSTLPEL